MLAPPGKTLPGRTPGRPANNLPLELSSFVRSGREVGKVRDRLTDARLLTLTSPGGAAEPG